MNLEKQVSGLYPIDKDKRRTLEITRVMKGALSVSKSRTGEAIYRSNEFHRKTLEKTVRQYSSATKTEINTYDSKQRNIIRRFSVMFGKHKATNETISAYDNVISRTLDETADKLQPRNYKIRSKLDVEEDKSDNEDDEKDDPGALSPNSKDNVQSIKGSLEETERKKSVFIPTGILLPLHAKGYTRLKFHNEVEEVEPEVVEEEVKEMWPLENTEKFDNFIRKQKDRHEVLVTRNILKKIKKNITGKDTLLKFQMKSYLTDDPEDFVRKLTSAKTAPSEIIPLRRKSHHLKKYAESTTSLPNIFMEKTPPSYAPQDSARSKIFPPITLRSSKSTGNMRSIARSKTMPL